MGDDGGGDSGAGETTADDDRPDRPYKFKHRDHGGGGSSAAANKEILKKLEAVNDAQRKSHGEVKQQLADVKTQMAGRLDEVETNIKGHVTQAMDVMTSMMLSQFSRVLTDLDFIKKETRKGQFSVELSRIRDNARALDGKVQKALADIEKRAATIPEMGAEGNIVCIVDRVPNKVPVCYGERQMYINAPLITPTGYFNSDGTSFEGFVELERIAAIPGCQQLPIALYSNNAGYTCNQIFEKILDDIVYYNQTYGLDLKMTDFTPYTVDDFPDHKMIKNSSWKAATFVVEGCVICGSDKPTIGPKRKCAKCKGKPRGNSTVCQSCGNYALILKTGACADCTKNSDECQCIIL